MVTIVLLGRLILIITAAVGIEFHSPSHPTLRKKPWEFLRNSHTQCFTHITSTSSIHIYILHTLRLFVGCIFCCLLCRPILSVHLVGTGTVLLQCVTHDNYNTGRPVGIHHSPHTHTILISKPIGIPMEIPISTAALLTVTRV